MLLSLKRFSSRRTRTSRRARARHRAWQPTAERLENRRLLTNFVDFSLVVDASNIGAQDYARAVVIDPTNGNITAAGRARRDDDSNQDFSVIRLNDNGSLDTSFYGDGTAKYWIGPLNDIGEDVELDANGRIVVAGWADRDTSPSSDYDFAVIRTDTNGSLDNSFEGDGKLTYDFGNGDDKAYALKIDPATNDAYVVGAAMSAGGHEDFAMLRINSSGVVEQAVTTDLSGGIDRALEIEILPDGDLLLIGRSSNAAGSHQLALARYNPDFTLDPAFGTGGIVVADPNPPGGTGPLNNAVVDSSGRIVAVGHVKDAAGQNDSLIARFNSDGSPDTSFDGDGLLILPLSTGSDRGRDIAIDAEGRYVVGGDTTNADGDAYVARLNPNGSLDPTFGPGGTGIEVFDYGQADGVEELTIDDQGRIVVVGKVNDPVESDTAIFRLDPTYAIGLQTVAEDDFESAEFGGGSGWNGNWSWSGDTSVRTGGGANSGAYHMRLRRSTGYAERSVDLSALTSATLLFSSKVNSFENSDKAWVKVSPDGVSWTTVHEFTPADSDNTYHDYEIDLSAFSLTNDFHIAFDAGMSGSGDYWYLDDVVVRGVAGIPNTPPTADAGGQHASIEGSSVVLDGSASSDSDGTIVSYAWDFDNDGQYNDATGATPSFTPLQPGALTIGLQVTDDAGATATDTTTVNVTNVGPTADAGGPYAGNEGSNVTLDASGSSEPGDNIVSYDWDLDGDGQFDDASGQSVVFNSADDGVFNIQLRVTDDGGDTSTDSTSVTVSNVGPDADAGGPYATQESVPVTLSAAGSSDPGNDIVSYDWDLDGDGQYDDATGVTTEFSSAVTGDYSVAVRVTDDDGASSVDSTTVTVSAASTEVVVFEDSFEVGTWNGNWVEDSQNDWFRSTQRATDGVRSAEVDGYANNATLTMANAVDLSGFAEATLTFSWYIESRFDSGEYVALDISTDGGATWQTSVLQLDGNQDQENTWHHEMVDLAPYQSSNVLIRFRAKASRSNEDANVDNVRIIGSGSTGSAMMSTPPPSSQADDNFFASGDLGLL